MARYGKTVNMVGEIVTKALNNPGKEFKRSSYRAYVEDHKLYFFHYGTRTLVFNLIDRTIESWAGYSASDRDSLNTVLDELDAPSGYYFHCRGGLSLEIPEGVTV